MKEILERLSRLEEGYIETLKRELEEKNEQLRGKDDLLRNFQVLLRETQEKVKKLEGEILDKRKEQKKPLLERLKWWNKR